MIAIDTTPALGLVSKPIPNGGTYTLTTLLGEFLQRAEEIAGPRDTTWTVLGLEFFGKEEDGAVPHIWFPGDRRDIAIRLTENARCELPRAVFQLAHEAAHLVSPHKRIPAPNIEEGFATILADEMLRKFFGLSYEIDSRYQAAYEDTKSLLAFAPSGIADARRIQPNIWMITPEILRRIVPKIDQPLAERLCSRWP